MSPITVSGGALAGYVLGSDGNVYAWGWNDSGQLGNGSTTDTSTPTPVSLPAGVTATAIAAAGGGTAYALGSDGNIYAWGEGEFGQLGNGTEVSSSTPVRVSLPAGVTATAISVGVGVDSGNFANLALSSAGNIYAWGTNAFGQLGNGTVTESLTPVQVSLPNGVTATAVSESGETSLALGSNGYVYAWGDGENGQLGNGAISVSSTPEQVQLPGGVTAAAVYEDGLTSLALGSNGNVYAWGDNEAGELGDGTFGGYSLTPAQVPMPGGVTVTAISAGYSGGGLTVLALGSDGDIYGWGNNENGQLGDGTTTEPLTPVQVSLPGGVAATQLSQGGETSLALGSDGNLYAWGDNDYGQLGDGTTADSLTPVRVLLPSGTVPTAAFGGLTSTAIATGGTSAPVPTAITLSASPATAEPGEAVTLTAQVTAACGMVPNGSVDFEVNGTSIGSVSIASEYNGTVTLTTTFAAVGSTPVTAEFIPDQPDAYTASTASLLELGPDSGQLAGSVPVSTTVPPTGALSVTVVNSSVPLTENSAGTQATGTLGDVTVTDSRNTYPGWSVSGQEADFTGSGTAAGFSILADQLGWVPAAVGTVGTGVTVGPPIAPGTNSGGLGDTGGVLFSATPGNGYGTNEASAALTLNIPAEQAAGSYAGSMTITYLSVGP